MKYIIDIPDKYVMTTNPKKLMILEKGVTIATGIELTPYTEPDRQAIEDEVWEFVGKIQKMTCEQMHEVLGITAPNYDDFCNEISYQDAKAKYEEWKKQKDEIRVGDEVEYECGGEKIRFIVTGVKDSTAYGFRQLMEYEDVSDVGEYCDIEDLWKTGRHFDEIEELLKKMKEGKS